MRTIVLASALAIATPARADGFLDVAGAVAVPVADKYWTDNVDPGPKLGVHVGAASNDSAGGMIGVDWTPIRSSSSNFGFGTSEVSIHRFRALASLMVLHRVSPRLVTSARLGAGVDITHVGYTVTILGSSSSGSDTDTGYAFEAGGGVWLDVGGSVQLGGELGLPIGHHSQHTNNNYTYNSYTSLDVDLLLAVRLWSR